MQTMILLYLLIVNAVAFLLMLVDKLKAKRGAWRIPEATLFSIAILGGSIGSILGMYHFHHKTKHWYFVVINILSLIIHVFVGYLILTKFN